MREYAVGAGEVSGSDFRVSGDFVRALICDLRSGRFYAPDGRWTRRRDEACDFRSTRAASAFAEEHRFRGIELVLTSESSGEDLRVAVDGGLSPDKRNRDFDRRTNFVRSQS